MQATILLLPFALWRDKPFTNDAMIDFANKAVKAGVYEPAGTFDDMEGFRGETNEEAIAEEMFDLTNNPYRQDERVKTYGNGRSVSSGDVINVNGTLFLCLPIGWHKL